MFAMNTQGCLVVYFKGTGWPSLTVKRLEENNLFIHKDVTDMWHICTKKEDHNINEHTASKQLLSITHYHSDALLTAARRFMGHDAKNPLYTYPSRNIYC